MNIQKGELARRLYKGEGSVRLEDEIILPDYCPDVVRLIRMEALPCVDKETVWLQDGALSVEVTGRVEVCLLYTDGEDTSSYAYSIPFTHTFKKDIGRGIKVSPDSLTAFVMPLPTVTSPRVLSPRRVLARCDIRLSCEVMGNAVYDAFDPCDDIARLELDRRESTVSRLVGSVRREFCLKQEVKLPSTLPSVARVLSCRTVMGVDSVHPSSDSAAVFLTASFNVLYVAEESGALVSFTQPVEVREELSVDDCSESSVCRVRACVGGCETKILSDSFGESRVISLELPYTLDMAVLENIETGFIGDVYGVGCKATCECVSEEALCFVGSLCESTSFREKVMLKTDAEEVTGVSAEVCVKGVGEDWVDLTLDISAVALSDGAPCGSISESLDMRVSVNIPDSIREATGEGAWCDAVVIPSFVDATASQGALEVSGELVCQAQVWKCFPVEFASSVEFSERDTTEGCVFYYPSEEDTLWTVGKRYGVSREAICKANGIEDGELPRVVEVSFG
ncbi:MAG: hypothetical protein IJP16_05280 [Clostridia bacterium]|nr:hypothetical protein [Clostridia bacterium]